MAVVELLVHSMFIVPLLPFGVNKKPAGSDASAVTDIEQVEGSDGSGGGGEDKESARSRTTLTQFHSSPHQARHCWSPNGGLTTSVESMRAVYTHPPSPSRSASAVVFGAVRPKIQRQGVLSLGSPLQSGSRYR